MKDKTAKSTVKSARKTVKDNLIVTINTQLSKIAADLNISGKKTDKQIKKAAGQLAKKLSKLFKPDADKLSAATSNPKPAAPLAAKAKPVSVASKPIKAAPAKPAGTTAKAKPAAKPLK